MRHLARTAFVAISIVLAAPAALAQESGHEPIDFYAFAQISASQLHARSGGFNAISGSVNSGSGVEWQPSGAIGLGGRIDVGFVSVRPEFEYQFPHEYVIKTDSFQLPNPNYRYKNRIRLDWVLIANLWMDVPLRRWLPDVPIVRDVTPFFGFGFGGTEISLSANDLQVRGKNESKSAVRMVGAGLSWDVLDWLTVETRYQYNDYGEAETKLGPGGTSGRIEQDLDGHEIRMGARARFWSW